MLENRPARTLSPELRQECERDSLYSEELKNIVMAHQNEIMSRIKDTAVKVIRAEYETTKGVVQIHSFFTKDCKLKYSHTIFKK